MVPIDVPTTRVVTLHDVAREAGVHSSTVSRALDPTRGAMVRGDTRQRIREVAERLGYRPHMVARGLQSGRTGTIGVVAADLGNTWVTPILHGLAAAIEVSGVLPFIAETQDNLGRLRKILDHMLGRRVDAIVVVAAQDGAREILEATARLVPVVIAARPLPGSSLPHVVHDDRLGGEMVAEHLHSLGHRVVTQIAGPSDVANFPLRSTGFSSYCVAHDIEEVRLGDRALRPVIEEGQRLMRAILELSNPRPTAVFSHNDLLAVGARAAIEEAGLTTPGDFSLIGYNDTPIVGHLVPPLTTVRYPSREVGEAAGNMVLRLLMGENPANVMLDPVLVIRESCAGCEF